MKLIRYGEPGKEKPGLRIEGKFYDVSHEVSDYNEDFFGSGGLRLLEKLNKPGQLKSIPADTRLGPPVARPSKLVCIGLNYSDHALESNMALPQEPVIFMKATSAMMGPYDNLLIPLQSRKTDYEVELAIVISQKTSHVEASRAMDYVAGFLVHNDFSEREYQLEKGGQWVKGKSCDSFAPIGPWLTTKDEISDVHNLRIWLSVNDEIKQDSNTAMLIFKIPHLVSYVSHFMTLLPGDIISTGTPAGVGMGQKPNPVYLKKGDHIKYGIEGLGECHQLATESKMESNS